MTPRRVFSAAAALTLLGAVAALAADQPGQKFNISAKDLARPYATPGVANPANKVARPAGVIPSVPAGFKIEIYASLHEPRWLATAPNGDIFVAEPGIGRVTLLREVNGKVEASTFASGFRRPHGMIVKQGVLYLGDLMGVWKLTYADGAKAPSKKEKVTTVADLSPKGYHWTRNLAMDSKGTIYIGIGSSSNVSEDAPTRATVQLVQPDGTLKDYATGLRNAVGLQFYPGTDNLFVTVNERDGLGDGLVPDYLTYVKPGAFYGWPYAYIGPHPDPNYGDKRPDLVAKTVAPDLLFPSHSAPLGLAFATGTQFPVAYRGGAFVALHGSWNSGTPTGYKVVYVPFRNGRPAGGYENFVTGFWDGVVKPGQGARVWGRPVGLTVMKDGSLLIGDDVGKVVWRVSYSGK